MSDKRVILQNANLIDGSGAQPRTGASLAIEGLGNRHIAHKLGCAAVTVGVHLTNIYRKAKVTGRIELTRLMSVDDSSS